MQLEALNTRQQFKGDPSFVLQERDKEILRCCYEQQFLVHEQIERFFFGSENTRNARRRVAKLKRAGLLRSDIAGGILKQHLLRLTNTGAAIGRGESPYEVPQSKKVDLLTLTHDRIVTDVRLRLRELWNGTWVPERALKDKYARIPDGLFQFEGSDVTVAVEIENSTKGYTRFVAIMNEWARTENVRVVLYVATGPKVFNAIEKLLATAPQRPAFALVDFGGLMNGQPACLSPRGSLDLFSRRTL